MPMWRCPHCGTPQAETARCWVCHRSSTACATCRHFRSSIAAQLGYCGLDRQRRPLRGDEIRACWEAATPIAEPSADPLRRPYPAAPDLDDDRTPVRRLEFVEVRSAPRPAARPGRRGGGRRTELVGAAAGTTGDQVSPVDASPEGDRDAPGAPEPRWSLWGEADA